MRSGQATGIALSIPLLLFIPFCIWQKASWWEWLILALMLSQTLGLAAHGMEEDGGYQIRMSIGTHRYTAKYSPNGAVIGYKWLNREDANFFSPQQGDQWKRGSIQAHEKPTEHNDAGIYFAYSPNSPALKAYEGPGRVLVKTEQWGDVVHHEDGGRASMSRIVGIVRKGD